MRRGLRRVEDLTPGSRVQSRGDSDTIALPAGTKSVQEPEASVGCSDSGNICDLICLEQFAGDSTFIAVTTSFPQKTED